MIYRSLAGIIETVEVATAGFLFAGGAHTGGVIPCLHSDPYHLIALFMQHEGGYGAVYTPLMATSTFPFLLISKTSMQRYGIGFRGIYQMRKLIIL